MKICEIFESVQGEGRFAGTPSLFIRVYGCNLRCETCDTKYAYSGSFKEYTPMELVEIICKSKKKHVIWTGGEPLLYKKELLEVVELRIFTGKCFHLETNGIIFSYSIPEEFYHITVSPKKHYPKVDKVIKFWKDYENVDFKFVVGSSNWTWTLDEIRSVIDKFKLELDRIWLMPEGRTSEELRQFDKQIWEFCVEFGCNYSDRLHIRVWDGIRGK